MTPGYRRGQVRQLPFRTSALAPVQAQGTQSALRKPCNR